MASTRLLFVSLTLSAALAACSAPQSQTSVVGPAPLVEAGEPGDTSGGPVEPPAEAPTEPEVRPWTEAFMRKSALVADRVEIRGPRGLLDHTVVQQDPENFTHETSTRPDGFWQRTAIRPDRDIYDPIRAQLDAMQIMALREVVLLERPGQVPVEVIAHGEVYWHDVGSGREKRGDRVVIEGAIEDPSQQASGAQDASAPAGRPRR